MSSPPPVVSSLEGPFTQSRIGTVVLSTPNTLFVDVGGTVMEVAFLLPFLSTAVSPPAAGTVVQLIRQDASWVAVGRVVGTGSNPILNPSFEDSEPGSFPVNWQTADISGVSTVAVTTTTSAPSGTRVARVFSAQASEHYLYSSPIAVNSGEIWSLAAFVGGDYGGGAQTADAKIDAMWYANMTDLFPTVSSPSITAVTSTDIPQYPPFRAISGSVTAPVTGFMRVALRSILAAGQALVWDAATARRS